MHLWEMHPYFLNKTPCFNLLDLLTSELRHIAGDTYKVYFEKVLTFMLRSYFGLKVDKISETRCFEAPELLSYYNSIVDAAHDAFNCHSTQEYLSIRECRYFYDKMAELLEKMKDM